MALLSFQGCFGINGRGLDGGLPERGAKQNFYCQAQVFGHMSTESSFILYSDFFR